MREALSLIIIALLLSARCKKVYDSITKRRTGDKVLCFKNIYKTTLDTVLLLLTEWNEFRIPSWNVLKKTMNSPVLGAGRNIYEKEEMKKIGLCTKEYKKIKYLCISVFNTNAIT